MKSLLQCVDAHRSYLRREGASKPLEWGVPFLDREIGPGMPGNVYIVAGDPNTGKSMFTLLLATSCREPSLVLSYEDEPPEVGSRVQHLPDANLQHVEVSFPFKAGILQADGTVRAAAKAGMRLLIVDYLGLLTYDGGGPLWSRTDEIREILKVLKGWARELGLVVVLAAHTKRREGQGKAAPKMWDLGESSALEKMARAIITLWEPERGKMEAVVVKSKSSPSGGRALYERRQHGWLYEIDLGADRPDAESIF